MKDFKVKGLIFSLSLFFMSLYTLHSPFSRSFKSKLPFLSAIPVAIDSLNSVHQHMSYDAPSRESLQLFCKQPSKELLPIFFGRQFIRDEIAQTRQLLMIAALKHANRAQNVALKSLSVEEKHASLLLLLLQLKDGFVKAHLKKCHILDNPSCTHPEYILHAVLLCRSAIRTWPVESLDKFLIGDLGAVPPALNFITFFCGCNKKHTRYRQCVS
jgi:hypothetical protein